MIICQIKFKIFTVKNRQCTGAYIIARVLNIAPVQYLDRSGFTFGGFEISLYFKISGCCINHFTGGNTLKFFLGGGNLGLQFFASCLALWLVQFRNHYLTGSLRFLQVANSFFIGGNWIKTIG